MQNSYQERLDSHSNDTTNNHEDLQGCHKPMKIHKIRKFYNKFMITYKEVYLKRFGRSGQGSGDRRWRAREGQLAAGNRQPAGAGAA